MSGSSEDPSGYLPARIGGTSSGRGSTQLSAGFSAFRAGSYRKAISSLTLALALVEAREDAVDSEIWCLLLLGSAYRMEGRRDRAVEVLERCRRRALETGHTKGSAITAFELGETYLQRNDMQLAEQRFGEAVEIWSHEPVEEIYLHALAHLADAMLTNGRRRAARRILSRLVDLPRLTGLVLTDDEAARLASLTGTTFGRLGMKGRAADAFTTSVRLGGPSRAAFAFLSLAEIGFQLGRIAECCLLLEAAEQWLDEAGPETEVRSHYLRGMLESRRGNLDAAIRSLTLTVRKMGDSAVGGAAEDSGLLLRISLHIAVLDAARGSELPPPEALRVEIPRGIARGYWRVMRHGAMLVSKVYFRPRHRHADRVIRELGADGAGDVR